MAPIPSEISYRLSGGILNADPALSLGGSMSVTAVPETPGGLLFPDVTNAETLTGLVEHRALYVVNESPTETWLDAVLWLVEESASPDTEIAVGTAVEAVSVPIVELLASPADPPTGVVFSTPASKDAGLAVGDLPPGAFRGFWIRRTVNKAAGAYMDTARLRCEGH